MVETPTGGLQVAGITANRVVSKNLATGTVVVRVKKGSTPANETLVTFVNMPNPSLGLKVCKAATTDLVGNPYTFTENAGPAYTISAGTISTPNCGPVHSYKLGTNVNIAELAVPNVDVTSITVSDNRGSNVNLAAGTVTATIGSGITVVTYTNGVHTPPAYGYIEVCKHAGDAYVTGSFDFTVTAPNFSTTQPVSVGQCTAAIQVPAGVVHVTEAARFPFTTSDITVQPASRFVSRNLPNRTVDVTVPVGDTSTETIVHFTNSTQTGQLKVCKALTANSGALAGHTFSFSVSDVNGTHTDSVIAGDAGTTTCVIDASSLPLGSAVSITENAVPSVQVVGVSISPAGQDNGSTATTAKLTIGSNITSATFTNEAYGTVEVCKKAADTSTATQTFQFSVNGGAAISVPAGQCSDPIAVPAGEATVSEAAATNFHLVGVTARGPVGDNRLASATTDNPATVAVPYGGVDNETVATFTNAVNTGEFKICKASPEPSLQNVAFSFAYNFTVDGVVHSGTASLKPTQCSALSDDIPVVDPSGNPIPVNISEAATPTVQVSNIAVANGTLYASDLGAGTATVSVKQGFTTVTYTNVRTPVGGSRFR